MAKKSRDTGLTPAKINKYVDIVMMLLLIPVLATSIALYFLPAGPQSGLAAFLGVGKQQWSNLHAVTGWLLIGLMLFHLVLHRGLIACWAKGK